MSGWNIELLEVLHIGAMGINEAARVLHDQNKVRFIADVEALENSGLVSRKRDPNHRQRKLISLTDKGQSLFNEFYLMEIDYGRKIKRCILE